MPTLPRTLPFAYDTGTIAVSSEVPAIWPAALNGQPLMIWDDDDEWMHQGIQMLRPQSDDSAQPSERSLNPEALWRRSQESWHMGAGQAFRDRDGADPLRFSASKGVDPWTPYQLTLLPDTDNKISGASTNYRLVPAGARLYLADGSALKYTTDVTAGSPTWSTCTGYSGGSILSLCSDGYTVYFTDGADVWTTNTGTAAASSVNTLNAGGLAWVKSRLMAFGTGATKHLIYNITTIGTPPTTMFTPFNTDFTWVGFAEGQAHIYAAGYSGDKSLIYRIQVKPDGTALDPPVVAGQLPDGEIIYEICGYLGFIFLGTSEGCRFCETDGQGNLVVGPLIDTGGIVRCFEGQGRFVWFGWSNYDGTSTGLGRMDLTQFTENTLTGARVPAYATDLMTTAQGAVLSVATFQSIRAYTVSGSGVWAEDTTKVASGTITAGRNYFGIPDPKIPLRLHVDCVALAGSYSVSLATDGGTAALIGTESDEGTTTVEFPITQTSGEFFEVSMTLTRDSSPTTAGPTITRWTLKAVAGQIEDAGNEYLTVPFLLASVIRVANGQEYAVDVKAVRDAIKALRHARTVVAYQELEDSHEVQVENYRWVPRGLRTDHGGVYTTSDGIMVTVMKVVN